ncbi:Cyclin-like F-box [Beauveria brongniartii RCEF 3172]|uniref:Cyclin-like F-box n=1 Tax=Beauveria brongniartii RCEF 3172 TaxID=1081107 RepID=A0A162LTP3_9HYPO|nr:Cyclin-like F-box [Beauveria brongniartii RCEF 3172]
MASHQPQENQRLLMRLPEELLAAVISHLTNRDIKSLRAVNSTFNRLAPLRFDRVFLSANSRNIDVFRAVADHDKLRHGITEIVWDDGRLKNCRYSSGDGLAAALELRKNDAIVAGYDCPYWYKKARRLSLAYAMGLEIDGESPPVLPDGIISLLDSWKYYKTLIQDQQAVLDSNADVEALKHGLVRFPSLKRITLVPSAHGPFVGRPLYQTPMLRDFPPNFGYLLPRNWPGMESPESLAEVYSWHGNDHMDEYGFDCSNEVYRNKWRGFRLLLRTLAENPHHITEFVMDMHHHRTGINCTIFSRPSQEAHDLVKLLSTPGFRRLDLALLTGAMERDKWPCLYTGILRRALTWAQQLEHISLSCTMDIYPNGRAARLGLDHQEGAVPLRTIFPLTLWPKLQHFAINRLPVRKADLVSFLAALPNSLRSVTLSHLAFIEEASSWQNLLRDMRDMLDWKTRIVGERPRVRIIVNNPDVIREWKFICIDKAADEFLYSSSEFSANPFGETDGSNDPIEGPGVMERSCIDRLFERPYRIENCECGLRVVHRH